MLSDEQIITAMCQVTLADGLSGALIAATFAMGDCCEIGAMASLMRTAGRTGTDEELAGQFRRLIRAAIRQMLMGIDPEGGGHGA